MAATSKMSWFWEADFCVSGSLPNGFSAKFEIGADHSSRPPFVIFPACGDHDFGLRRFYRLACCLCRYRRIWLRGLGVVCCWLRQRYLIIGNVNWSGLQHLWSWYRPLLEGWCNPSTKHVHLRTIGFIGFSFCHDLSPSCRTTLVAVTNAATRCQREITIHCIADVVLGF